MTAEDDAVRAALDYLQRESHQLDTARRLIAARVEHTLLLAVPALGAAAAVSLADRRWALALSLPWLVVLVWAIILAALNEAFVLAATRSVLEDQIERLLPRLQPVVRMVGWERGGARLAVRSTSSVFVMAVAASIGLAVCVLCFVLPWLKLPSWRSAIVIEAIAFLNVLAPGCYLTWKVLHVYESARTLLQSLPDLLPGSSALGRSARTRAGGVVTAQE
jgi:hypothetical protein